MTVLLADLSNDRYERIERASDAEGLEAGVLLFNEYSASDPIVIIPPSYDALRFSGSAVFSIIYRSPITGRMSLSFSSYAPGVSLRKLGNDAFVMIGKARSLSLLSVGSDGAERSVAVQYSGLSPLAFESAAGRGVGEVFLSVGRAAENGVRFASLMSGGRHIYGAGLGYLFAEKNIKGISFPLFPRKDFLGSGKVELRVRRRMERLPAAKRLRKEGGGVFIDAALRAGSLPVMNYSMRYDPRAYFLDGKAYNEKYGVYRESCQDCFLSCSRRKQDESLLPDWKEAMALGSDLSLFDPDDVSIVADAAREEGLEPVYLGAVLAALCNGRAPSAADAAAMVHSMGDGRDVRYLEDIPGSVVAEDGSAVLLDLRGSWTAALALIFSIPVDLTSSLLFQRRASGIGSSAVMALYESIYTLALISSGFSPAGSISEWWGRFPPFLYSIPLCARLIACGFSAYGKKGRMLAKEGYRILSLFSSSPQHIPDAFTLNPDSALSDGRTVPVSQLIAAYDREKERLERRLRSRRERSERPSGVRSAAVGPSEERGLDGDPGLTT